MAQTSSETRTVPFGPWVAFKSFLGDLKSKGVPPRIDRTMFPGKSGTDIRHIQTTLRFFKLVSVPGDAVTPALRDLVEAHGLDTWPAVLRGLLETHYSSVLEGVDLKVGTQGQLDEAFRGRGNVSGSTLKKGVRFFLAAAGEAGIDLSTHFKTLRVGGRGGNGAERPAAARAPGTKTKKARKVADPKGESEKPAEGTEEIRPLPRNDFRFWIPVDLSDAELTFGLRYLLDYLALTRNDYKFVPKK